MKHMTTILLGISLAVITGLFASSAFGLIGTKAHTEVSSASNTMFSGHVTTTLRDSEGNIKAYRQTDNQILNGGENCAIKMLFGNLGGSSTGTTVCTGANSDGYHYIGIGNGSNTIVQSTDTKLYQPHNATSTIGANAGTPSLARKAASISGSSGWSNSTASSSAGTGAASVVMSATYTYTGSNSITVNESGLFNTTEAQGSTNIQTDSMFARQVFTAITMNNNDSLTVQWTVNVGGATTLN